MKNCPNCNAEIPKGYDVCWKCNYDVIDGKIIPNIPFKEKGPYDRNIDCLRCNVKMKRIGKHRLHEGTELGFFGDLGHILNNWKSLDLYVCPKCEKVEFFIPLI